MTLACLALLLALPVQGRPAAPEAVLEVHDLRDAASPFDHRPLRTTLLPYLNGSGERTSWHYDQEPGIAAPMALLRALFPDELQYVDRDAWLDEQGRLLLSAPQPVQERVRAALGWLEAAATAGVDLRVEVLDLRDVRPQELPEAGAWTPEQLQPWVERARAAGGLALYALRVVPGRPAVLDLARELPVLGDYDVEVAQGGLQNDPIVSTVAIGTRIELRAAPGDGGLFLALNLTQGELLDGVRQRMLTRLALIVNEQARGIVPQPGLLQSPDVQARSLGLNTFLADGQVVVAHSRLDLPRASGVRIIALRSSGDSLPRVQEHGTAQGRRLALYNAERWSPPRVVLDLGEEGLPAVPGVPALPRSTRLRWSGGGDALLRSTLLPGSPELVERWRDRAPGGAGAHVAWPFLALADGAAPRLPAPDQRVVHVRLELRAPARGGRGDADARLAAASLPLRAGETSAVSLGVEELLVADYDVEVAQSIGVDDPHVVVAFEGLGAWLRPTFGANGDLLLDLSALGRAKEGETRLLDPGGDFRGALEQAQFRHLFAAQRLRFPSGPRSGSAVLGDQAGSGMSLAVRVAW